MVFSLAPAVYLMFRMNKLKLRNLYAKCKSMFCGALSPPARGWRQPRRHDMTQQLSKVPVPWPSDLPTATDGAY